MKFFLDTANTDDIRKYAELGLVVILKALLKK